MARNFPHRSAKSPDSQTSELLFLNGIKLALIIVGSLKEEFMWQAQNKQWTVISRNGNHDVDIPLGPVSLRGELSIPAEASHLVLFAHGSGSSRLSPRNQYVAQVMRKAGLSTLLFDLLTPDEEAIDVQTRHLRFDITMLARRLAAATEWIKSRAETAHLRIGYFGASTGAAAALIAAAEFGNGISAVVSRGGRPDLAGEALPKVTAPTLLIVGGLDEVVIRLNEEALARLQCVKKLKIVPGATHLFEEPGTLEEVARLAADWFRLQL